MAVAWVPAITTMAPLMSLTALARTRSFLMEGVLVSSTTTWGFSAATQSKKGVERMPSAMQSLMRTSWPAALATEAAPAM